MGAAGLIILSRIREMGVVTALAPAFLRMTPFGFKEVRSLIPTASPNSWLVLLRAERKIH
jgi:hypothetical protein